MQLCEDEREEWLIMENVMTELERGLAIYKGYECGGGVGGKDGARGSRIDNSNSNNRKSGRMKEMVVSNGG